MKNICFVIPQMKDGWLKMEYSSREALGVQYICSSLQSQNIKYNFINAHAYHIDDEEVCKEIIENSYDIIGVTCISQRSYPNVKKFILTLRNTFNYKGIIFVGGFFATLAYKEILFDLKGYVDFLTRGEGELIIPNIIRQLSNGIDVENLDGVVFLKNNMVSGYENTHYIEDLNVLPYPIRDPKVLENVAGEPKNFKMLAGRGCYNNCSFCSIIIDGRPRRKRYRTPENLVGEIEMLLNTYKDITHFRFCDEIFYTNTPFGKNWVNTFVNLVKQKKLKFTFHIEIRAVDITKEELLKLKEVGLVCVSIGYEAGVQRILDEMRKHCTVEQNLQASKVLKEVRIDNAISFITLIPTMSFEELKTNYAFLKEIGGYTAHNLYNKLNLYIGCEYEKILSDAGLLDGKNHFYERSNYRFSDCRVQFYSDMIDEMKSKVLLCRKFVFYASNVNQSVNGLVDYFDDIFKSFILRFVDFCMKNLDSHIMEHHIYSSFIDDSIQSMLEQLENFCQQNNLKYSLDLDNLTNDYLFV